MVMPHWDKVKADPTFSDIKFEEVVADTSPEAMDKARQFKVVQLPTFILEEDGKEVKRHTGFASEKQLRDLLS
jgi:thioredoxin-like negative regulator of GroEL